VSNLDQRYSYEKLIEFLKFAADKGLMATATAQSRASAAGKMFELASETEKVDVRTVDLDALCTKFENKYKTSYNPTSLGVYKSRVASSLAEFVKWSDNPSAYRPIATKSSNGKEATQSGANGKRKRAIAGTKKVSHEKGNENIASSTKDESQHNRVTETFAVPIPLRSRLTLTLNGMPFDLTETEAERICSVVKAYVIKP
jgi:hypothetical protein